MAEPIPEKEVILSEKIAMHGKANSIAVDIPPMSVMYLKPSSIQPEDEQEKIIDLEALTEQPNAEPIVEAKPKRTRKKAAPKAEEDQSAKEAHPQKGSSKGRGRIGRSSCRSKKQPQKGKGRGRIGRSSCRSKAKAHPQKGSSKGRGRTGRSSCRSKAEAHP